jgi:quercetin dioxygenase-like cupin family protein
MRKKAFAASALWLLAVGVAAAQHTIVPYADAPFAQDADVACLASALETGNPSSGPSTFILKAPPGCVVPWHWHTAQEQLMVVSGDVMAEMTGRAPTPLGPGGFAVMAGNMAHQFTCQGRDSCVMFVTFDGAYDIKWGRRP